MIININIDIEISKEEIHLLRKHFNNGRTSKQFWAPRPNLSVYSEEIVKEYNIVESLLNKEVFKKDMMNNYTLTTIGNIIVDKIDRDKIINNILG
jgi:hypothetical protein